MGRPANIVLGPTSGPDARATPAGPAGHTSVGGHTVAAALCTVPQRQRRVLSWQHVTPVALPL